MNPKKPFRVEQSIEVGRLRFSVIDYYSSFGQKLKREYKIGRKEVSVSLFFDELFTSLANEGLLNAKRIVREV